MSLLGTCRSPYIRNAALFISLNTCQKSHSKRTNTFHFTQGQCLHDASIIPTCAVHYRHSAFRKKPGTYDTYRTACSFSFGIVSYKSLFAAGMDEYSTFERSIDRSWPLGAAMTVSSTKGSNRSCVRASGCMWDVGGCSAFGNGPASCYISHPYGVTTCPSATSCVKKEATKVD